MASTSPQSLIVAGIAVAGMSYKLKTDYSYLYYIGVTLGLILFVFGIIKHFHQRNRFK